MAANRARGLSCNPGDLVDIALMVDVLNTGDGTVDTASGVTAVLGTPGTQLVFIPPDAGEYELVELTPEGGVEATTLGLGTDVLYIGDIQSGATKDGRKVWTGSTNSRNRCSARVLTPDSRFYVNTDPLRVGELNTFDNKTPLYVGLGITGSNNVTNLSVLATFACAKN